METDTHYTVPQFLNYGLCTYNLQLQMIRRYTFTMVEIFFEIMIFYLCSLESVTTSIKDYKSWIGSLYTL